MINHKYEFCLTKNLTADKFKIKFQIVQIDKLNSKSIIIIKDNDKNGNERPNV